MSIKLRASGQSWEHNAAWLGCLLDKLDTIMLTWITEYKVQFCFLLIFTRNNFKNETNLEQEIFTETYQDMEIFIDVQ